MKVIDRLIGIGFAALVAIGLYKGPASTPAAASHDDCTDTTMAFVMSLKFVKDRLKAPATASFPWSSLDGVSTTVSGYCQFRVNAYVDSENSFGANLRSHYSMDLRYNQADEMWYAANVVIQ
ncbi:hypothetical protein [Mesorhizobium sp. WSM3860]|uniref:hypothetical protein n=1 Tax=Mesorhizobium sp. WSM3860 TaxID=2029403 RepID=UPI000BAFFB9A|nr:hypothetical protein [Mesorhizobium sp. WSM3860]PBC04838.1 hypothetical protein CK220_07460 [Mesorhizobium sp. WSM3860]